jgi:serine/threonine protein kinase
LYISPEIVRGEKYDASTDVWSLGVTFYEIMALKRAFDTNVDIDDLNEKIKKGDVDPLPDMYSKDF